MALDQVIIDHLDDIELLEGRLEEEVETLYKQLNVDDLINNPEETLMILADKVSSLLQDKYYPEATQSGIDFAMTVRKDGEIEIPGGKDPTLNKELAISGELSK